jgi:putative hydrolase of the HAD superfamily
MPVDAVVFDWGGTLTALPAADADLLALWRLAAAHIADHLATGQTNSHVPGADEIAAHLLAVERAAWDRAVESGRSFTLSEVLDEASASLGLDVAAAVLDEAATRHLDGWTARIVHDPDAREVLEALHSKGVRTGLLSNTHWPRHVHEHFLERDGLADLIDVRCYTSDLTHLKPHPEAFRTVLAQLDVAPERAVFVGDRPIDDITGALGVGMFAVWRVTPDLPLTDGIVPHAQIERLPELLEVLDRLEPLERAG